MSADISGKSQDSYGAADRIADILRRPRLIALYTGIGSLVGVLIGFIATGGVSGNLLALISVGVTLFIMSAWRNAKGVVRE